jgi:hypothetical protein
MMLRVQPATPVVGRRDVANPARTISKPKPASRLPVPAPAQSPSPVPVSPSPSPSSASSYTASTSATWYRVPTAYDRPRTHPDTLLARPHPPATRAHRLPPRPARVPPTPSIPHLRDALFAIDSKVAALLRERARLSLSLEQAVRLQAPISRLPSELLVHILTLGVLEPDDNDDPLVLSNLMLVCRHWAALVRDTSVLWSRIIISPHHPLSRARLRLARSKSVPLDISLVFDTRRDTPGARAPTDQILARALDLLVPHIARWRSFHLAVPEPPQAHAALARCAAPAPLLASLTVRIFNTLQDEETDAPPAPALFAGLAPRLRACTLHALAFDWRAPAPRLAGLRVLDLGGYWSGAPPSAAAILEMLRACPELEELALRSMSDDETADADAYAYEPHAGARIPPAAVVALPRLRRATFHYAGVQRARAVLAQLAFPALEEVELCYLDNATLVLPHLGRQALTALPLRRLRIEQGSCAERDLLKLLARVPTLTVLELIDVEDISSGFLKVSLPPVSFLPGRGADSTVTGSCVTRAERVAVPQPRDPHPRWLHDARLRRTTYVRRGAPVAANARVSAGIACSSLGHPLALSASVHCQPILRP